MRKTLSIAVVLLCLGTFAMAQEGQPQQMTAEQQAQMEAFIKAMTPGEPHKLLDHMAGTFNTKVTMWQAAGAPPQTSDGVTENKWVLGGRYLEQRFTGSMMGMPFEGIGYSGYDNVKKQYWGTWVDNMSTGIMTTTGNTKDKGKTFWFKGTYADPMTGKDAAMEEKIVVESADKHVFEMWGPGPDGKNFKMMEIVYTRKK